MLMEAILVGLWVGLAGVDFYDGCFMIGRPVITGTVVGFILGDLQTGLITGAALEMAWLGLMPLAGAQPPNTTIGSAVGTAFAVLGGFDPQATIGIAMPFAIGMQALIVLMFTAFSPIMHKADKFADEGNANGITKINYAGLGTLFVMYFLMAFLPVYFGQEAAAFITTVLPQTLIDGLSVAGGMMPALGFAMLMKMMFKKDFAVYLFIGFFLATFLKLPIVAIAAFGICIAVIDFGNNLKKQSQQTAAQESVEDGI